jgi:hypothetical protein
VILLAPEDGFNNDLLWTSMDWMVLTASKYSGGDPSLYGSLRIFYRAGSEKDKQTVNTSVLE